MYSQKKALQVVGITAVGPQKQKAFVLVVVLLLMTILSLSAYVAVEQSQFSYKLNNARISHMKARQISDDARLSVVAEFEHFIQQPLTRDEGSNTSSKKTQDDDKKRVLSLSENTSKADVYLKELPAQILKNGVSISQNMTYSGLGMGLGYHGSFSKHYELSAKGVAYNKGSEVTYWTASDYRYIP